MSHFWNGQFLLAMPGMRDQRFDHSVILLCSHDQSGAMGLVINQQAEGPDFASLLDQLDIAAENPPDITIHAGGPMEPGRGFVLHSADYVQESTLIVNERIALTATVDVLHAIAHGEGPQDFLLALGYAGWGAGQLEEEIRQNAWMIADGHEDIVFHTELASKWPRSMAMMGIDTTLLSAEAGSA